MSNSTMLLKFYTSKIDFEIFKSEIKDTLNPIDKSTN